MTFANGTVTIGTSEALLAPTDPIVWKWVIIQVGTLSYIGATGVTATNGFHLAVKTGSGPNALLRLENVRLDKIYGLSSSGNAVFQWFGMKQ